VWQEAENRKYTIMAVYLQLILGKEIANVDELFYGKA
jgi:hypothetical protein